MIEVAIAGAAESDVGEVGADVTPVDLMRQATLRALDDCGLELEDIDGLFAACGQLAQAPLDLGESLGILPQLRVLDGTSVGGTSALVHLEHARDAIAAGRCEVALIGYGSTQRSVGRASLGARSDISPWEAPYAPALPVSAFALAASRHMSQYGTTREQLAAVAVSARAWARLNPRAWVREPLSVADVLAARMVADPLGVRDCCLVTDAGGALIVTSAERARSLRREPVHLLGVASASSHRYISAAQGDITATAAARTGPIALAQAGVDRTALDSVQIYDAFTITPILFLEDLGFCAKGDGGPFVADGRIAPDGAFPMNTNGGGLSYQHPGMYGMLLLTEAIRRVRETDDHVVLGHAVGGPLSNHATVVLGDSTTR